MSTTVFVSGATGFIAQHVVLLLLAKGYNVVGSVRTPEKGEKLKNLFTSDAFSYEVVPDVEPEGAFDKALENHPEVTVFVHTASPFHFKATDIEKELLLPAVNGTINALKAIQVHGPQIKNVVITSSYAAMMDITKLDDPTQVDNEETWNPMSWEDSKQSAFAGYIGSKKFAERAAWDFVKENQPKFTVNFVNPGYVFGPQVFDSEVKEELNTSSEIINGLVKSGSNTPVPEAAGFYVDVRDVAQAHLVAFEKDISNKRLLLATSKFNAQEIADIINDNFESLRGKIPAGIPGAGMIISAGINNFENKSTRDILGYPLIDLETSIVDTVAQIIKVNGN